MELLNRYLHAVGARLPEAYREDIVAELRGELLSRIEEREGELKHHAVRGAPRVRTTAEGETAARTASGS